MFIATILYIKVPWYSEKNVATKLSGWATKNFFFFFAASKEFIMMIGTKSKA